MRTLLALAVVQLVTLGAFAQSSEFGRASGGTIEAITKGPSEFSGTLSFSQSTGGSRRGRGYEGSLGGELINDKLWFFGAASILPRVQFSNVNVPNVTAFDAKATAQPVDWSHVTASFSGLQQQTYDGALPSSFLSLRSTSVLSDRMTLDLSFSASR